MIIIANLRGPMNALLDILEQNLLKHPICWPRFVDFHHKRYITTSITTRNNEHSEIDRPIISPPAGDFFESKGKNYLVRA